jgi:methionyl-tRNA formyltransferase
MNNQKINFAFFGSSEFSIYVLDELKLHNLVPSLIVTTPDKPKGRKLVLTPNVVKTWAIENGIEYLDPKSLRNNPELVETLKSKKFDLFLVASYGKIIPKEIFEIPLRKTLNVHPSMLPKYRGASPIESQILNDEPNIGASIMQIEETMDTGPVLVQKKISISQYSLEQPGSFSAEKDPPSHASRAPKVALENTAHASDSVSSPLSFARRGAGGEVVGRVELEKILAKEGARLFAHIVPEWMSGALDPIPQNENLATYCGKIEKKDAELNIDLKNLPTADEARKVLLKIKAYEGWPECFTFVEKNGNKIRVIIRAAHIENDALCIDRVVPEGKNEMSFEDFSRGYLS